MADGQDVWDVISFVFDLLTARGDKKPGNYTICPQCEEVRKARKLPDLKCPNCGTCLESLEGYYERHPERSVEPPVSKG